MSDMEISSVARQFDIRGRVLSCERYGSGHINDTYRIAVSQGGTVVPYILQRINTRVFPDAAMLMQNIRRVTQHVAEKIAAAGGEPTRETLTLIPSLDGSDFVKDADGNVWRMYIFVENALSYNEITAPEQAFEAARAFGTFQKHLADLPGAPLGETIPHFHDTPRRFAALHHAIEKDALNRAAMVQPEINFALAQESWIDTVVKGLSDGTIPSRVTHNDTKINNVLFDAQSQKGLCVIDLDTVMPGSVLYDFGDEIRTTTATAAEDERDLSKVQFRLDLFEALVGGYLNAAQEFLVPTERKLLALGGALMTYEVGIRFLTDFLEGDVYFKIHRENHNVDRCRTQFALTRQMLEQMDAMNAIVERV